MSRIVILLVSFLVGLNTFIWAQDSTKVLSSDQFMQMVLQNHPVVKQYALLTESAKMEVRMARGKFDPEFDLDYNNKVFKGTNYYGYTDAGLKVPLWFGPDLKLGYENNTGEYINNSDYTPPGGLSYLGIHIPLSAELIMDERRAIVRQAQIGQKITEAERVKLINKFIIL